MLKKFHWGWGIAIFYTVFACFILMMVYQSTRYKVELVTPDYYAQELKYQERIHQIENAKRLKTPLQWEVQGKEIHLQFPYSGKEVKSKILFYKPNSSAKDVAVECSPDDSGRCVITSDKLEPGVYQMQVEWQAHEISYYNETTIHLK